MKSIKLIINTALILFALMGLESCGNTVVYNEYFLHNTTDHIVTIVNTKSSFTNNYDSIQLAAGDYYPFVLTSFTKEESDYHSALNIYSKLYIYNRDTCYYIHYGDESQNCLWKYAYRTPSDEESSTLSAINQQHNYVYGNKNFDMHIFDLTDENIGVNSEIRK